MLDGALLLADEQGQVRLLWHGVDAGHGGLPSGSIFVMAGARCRTCSALCPRRAFDSRNLFFSRANR
jgi:hypothetical protein